MKVQILNNKTMKVRSIKHKNKIKIWILKTKTKIRILTTKDEGADPKNKTNDDPDTTNLKMKVQILKANK